MLTIWYFKICLDRSYVKRSYNMHTQNQKPHKAKGYKETSESIRYAYDLDSGDSIKGACMFLNLPNCIH